MEITPIVPGCYHFQTGEHKALFGAPPEVLKFIIRANKQIPAVGVLPDVAYVNGVSQVALEFPVYWFMFFADNKDRATRFRVIGTPEMCERVRQILTITLIGPTPAQLKAWKLSKTRISMLNKIMNHLAFKNGGKRLCVDDLFEFVHFPEDQAQGIPLFENEKTVVWRLGGNRFKIGMGRRRETIDLNFDGDQLPLLSEPNEELELPRYSGSSCWEATPALTPPVPQREWCSGSTATAS